MVLLGRQPLRSATLRQDTRAALPKASEGNMGNMIKIALSTIPTEKFVYKYYTCSSLLYLSSYLKKYSMRAYEITYMDDFIGIKEYIKRIVEFSPDIIAYSCSFHSFREFESIVKTIRAYLPKVKIIAGGNYVTVNPRVFLDAGSDACVLGEGERTFFELVESYTRKTGFQNLESIKGIAFKERKMVITKPRELIFPLEEIPYPDYGLVDLRRYPGYYYQKNRPDMYIVTYRGCLHSCSFCSNPVWRNNKVKFRLRDPADIAKEVHLLYTKYGIREIYDYSDYFNINLKWAKKVCAEIKKLGFKDLAFKFQLRVDNIDEEFVRNIKEIGGWFVHIGIESANKEALEGIRKEITTEQVINACRILKKHDMKVGGFFMLLNIWEENNRLKHETPEMCRKTLDFIKYLMNNNLIDYFSFSFLTPTPGSESYRIAQKYRLLENHNDYNVDACTIKLPDIEKKDILRIKRQALMIQTLAAIKGRTLNFRNMYSYVYKYTQMLKNFRS